MESSFAHLHCAGITDTGVKRKNNEDVFGVFPEYGFFCVADGMGGAEDGEVASKAAVDAVGKMLRRFPAEPPLAHGALLDWLAVALNEASAWIHQRAVSRGTRGTGSTFIGVHFDPEDPAVLTVVHAGDSRAYRIRNREIKQLMRDHSAAALAGVKNEKDLNPMFRGMVMRAVGIEPAVELERTSWDVREKDIILICSDGLTRMVKDKEIRDVIRKSKEIEDAAKNLVNRANKNGGVDNVTVVLVAVGPLPLPTLTVSPEVPKENEKAGVIEDEPTTQGTAEGEASHTDSTHQFVDIPVTPATPVDAGCSVNPQEPSAPEVPMPEQVHESPSGGPDSGTFRSDGTEADGEPKPGWGKIRRCLVLSAVLFAGAGALLFHLNRDESNPSETGASAAVESVELKAERDRVAAQARAEETRRAAETAAREKAEQEKAERDRVAALARAEEARRVAETAARKKAEQEKAEQDRVAVLAREEEARRVAETAKNDQQQGADPVVSLIRLGRQEDILREFVRVLDDYPSDNLATLKKNLLDTARDLVVWADGKARKKDQPSARASFQSQEDKKVVLAFVGALANVAADVELAANDWSAKVQKFTRDSGSTKDAQEAEKTYQSWAACVEACSRHKELEKDEAQLALVSLAKDTSINIQKLKNIMGKTLPTR